MNKKYLILAATLLILGGCTKQGVVSNVVDKVEQKKEEAKKSIKDLVASGVSQKCSWKSDVDGTTSEGQMWISGKKFKQEITTELAETNVETKATVVSDGSYTYMWNSEMGKKGIKMAIKDDETQDYSAENGKVDWNKEFQFECNPSTVSDSELAPPTDVDFQDLGVQLEQLQQLQEKYGQGE
ncbi:hypothetical protein HYV64_03550 [Candidatus Shapirobacteria bacterium]|nr:hypothetical protein [Candidatus Shapirobacteria bacterium]